MSTPVFLINFASVLYNLGFAFPNSISTYRSSMTSKTVRTIRAVAETPRRSKSTVTLSPNDNLAQS